VKAARNVASPLGTIDSESLISRTRSRSELRPLYYSQSRNSGVFRRRSKSILADRSDENRSSLRDRQVLTSDDMPGEGRRTLSRISTDSRRAFAPFRAWKMLQNGCIGICSRLRRQTFAKPNPDLNPPGKESVSLQMISAMFDVLSGFFERWG